MKTPGKKQIQKLTSIYTQGEEQLRAWCQVIEACERFCWWPLEGPTYLKRLSPVTQETECSFTELTV